MSGRKGYAAEIRGMDREGLDHDYADGPYDSPRLNAEHARVIADGYDVTTLDALATLEPRYAVVYRNIAAARRLLGE